jgi:carbon monoxide dehydrogenase subunit G
MHMKFTGTYNFQASVFQVYDALLNPSFLQKSIPGCEAAWWPDTDHMKVRLTLPIPVAGLQGPYDATLRILEQEAPHLLVLHVGRTGRIGGTVATVTRITLTNEETGSRLTYDSQIDLKGPIAFAGSPIFQDLFKHMLSKFFTNLDKELMKTTIVS